MKIPIHLTSPAAFWRLTIFTRGDDPLVLARTLQKTAVPEIVLEKIAYARRSGRIDLTVCCTASRAELTRQKLERFADVRRADLQTAPDDPLRPVPFAVTK